MKKWGKRIILLAVLGALGYWGWTVLFPSPEKVIRKQLGELARTASFSSNEGLMAKGWNAALLVGFFTTDGPVTIHVPGAQHTITGRDELIQAALGARQLVNSLTIDFPDIKVTVAPGKQFSCTTMTI